MLRLKHLPHFTNHTTNTCGRCLQGSITRVLNQSCYLSSKTVPTKGVFKYFYKRYATK